jgi:hypothetical protein
MAPAPSYVVEGPYGPYSDLVPNTGQVTTANTPFAGLPNAPYPYNPAAAAPAYPVAPYPAPPAYQPAYVPPPPPPVPAYSQYPQPAPGPAPQYAQGTPAPAGVTAKQQRVTQQQAEADEGADKKGGDPLWGYITEVKAGLLYHDAGVFGKHEERGADIDGEVRFLPSELLSFIGSPRPHLGFHANTAGDTSQFFGGITWEWFLLDALFADFSVGLSLNNDNGLTTDKPHTKELGSPILARFSGEIGWNFSGPHSISIIVDHVSQGTVINKENEGMDSLGVRYGYRF